MFLQLSIVEWKTFKVSPEEFFIFEVMRISSLEVIGSDLPKQICSSVLLPVSKLLKKASLVFFFKKDQCSK